MSAAESVCRRTVPLEAISIDEADGLPALRLGVRKWQAATFIMDYNTLEIEYAFAEREPWAGEMRFGRKPS